MRYTYVQQHDATDCAAACMAMICLHYKKEITITALRDMMGTDIRGTNLVGLSKCAEMLGFVSQAVRVDREGFQSKYTLPAIAHLITKDGYTHYVVVFKISKKYVVIGDPGKDLERITIDEFYERFTGILLILAPTNSFVSESNKSKSIFGRYIELMLPQKKLFFYAMLASMLLTVLGIVSSLFSNLIYDEILPYQQENVLRIVLIVFAIVSLTSVAITFIKKWILLHLSIKIDIPLMLGYFEHIYKLPMKFFASRKTGDITTRFSDACTIKNIFSSIALSLIMDITMAIITGTILFQMNFRLFSIIFFMMLISIMLILLFRQPYKKINMEQMQQASVLNSEIIEGLRAVETIKGNANEEMELENIEREYIRSLHIGYKEGMLSNIQGTISGAVSVIGNLVLLYVGISQVIRNELTLGSYMAFTALSGYFMTPMSNLIGLQLSIQEANISMKRLAEIMDYETEQEGADKTEKVDATLSRNRRIDNSYQNVDSVTGDIVFDNVTFRYGSRKPALLNVSFTIPKGKKVAIVGASGSGKSTIAKLILKYYEQESGEIYIDGTNIRDLCNTSLRKAISYIPQNIELFSKSIFENIRVTRMNASLEEVKDAAKLADAHEFISKLPLKYDTHLEEAGNGLSGGEKQRIAIARAFLKDSQFYIMDEGTSNLDFATENLIIDMIFKKKKKKTMLIIAHRLATIKNCDNIIVLDQGHILEQGTHEELMKKKGQYYQLWEMQQGNYHIKETGMQTKTMISEQNLNDDVMIYT